MTDKVREFERLNAFVDGELERDDRLAVVEASAGDNSVARHLSALSQLKSALQDSVDVPELDIPEPPSAGRIWGTHKLMALAASVVLFAAIGMSWLLADYNQYESGVPVAWAVEAHQRWATKPGTLIRPRQMLLVRAKLNAHVPDLTSAGLSLVHMAIQRDPEGADAMVIGYRGTRGCRVTLLIDKVDNFQVEKPLYIETGKVRAVAWRAGPLSYVVLAEAMELNRFRLIADSVRRASLERLPLDDPTRTLLADSRASSPPCGA